MSGETSSVLYTAQNLFYLGAYQAAINECSNIQPQLKGQALTDLKVLLYRSYIGLKKFNLVLGETEKQDVPELKGIHLFAKASAIKALDREAKAKFVDELSELATEGSNILNVNLKILSAIACCSADKLEPALKAVSLQPNNLEWYVLNPRNCDNESYVKCCHQSTDLAESGQSRSSPKGACCSEILG